MDNNFYYIAEVRKPGTCSVCGYIVKEARSKTRVQGCPVYKDRAKAERYLKDITLRT